MTEPFGKTVPQRASKGAFPPRRLLFSGMSLFFLALIIRNSELAMHAMTRGLRLCAVSVIPAVFPFMVLSEWIVSSGALQAVGRWFDRPFRFLFGISGDGAGALLLGWLCGFPVGVRAALSLYRHQRIDRRELSRILPCANLPGSAFLIGTVGITLFGDRAMGVRLYIITLLSSVTVGLLRHWLTPSSIKKKTALPSHTSLSPIPPAKGVSLFTDAIASSAFAMLQICAFVVFFSVLSDTVSFLFAELTLPRALTCLLYGLLELTGGTAKAAELSPPLSELLCAFFVGWSGCSVHCQLIGLCDRGELSLRPYLLTKLAQGICNILLWRLLQLFIA